jgi:hypothetical protein
VLGAIWGMAGVVFILARAVLVLLPQALVPLERGIRPSLALLYLLSIAFNGYAEGYRAFHKKFSPRVAARALHLLRDRSTVHLLLAPLFVMAFFHAPRRRLIATWVMLVALVLLIWAVRQVPQPWRGVIDAGVVVALTWGIASLLYFFVRGLRGVEPPASAELPRP